MFIDGLSLCELIDYMNKVKLSEDEKKLPKWLQNMILQNRRDNFKNELVLKQYSDLETKFKEYRNHVINEIIEKG